MSLPAQILLGELRLPAQDHRPGGCDRARAGRACGARPGAAPAPKLEPDPSAPQYILTVRNKGYLLALLR